MNQNGPTRATNNQVVYNTKMGKNFDFSILAQCLTKFGKGCGGGIMVRILAFYSEDLSSNPAGY